jgi:hypothetical protein
MIPTFEIGFAGKKRMIHLIFIASLIFGTAFASTSLKIKLESKGKEAINKIGNYNSTKDIKFRKSKPCQWMVNHAYRMYVDKVLKSWTQISSRYNQNFYKIIFKDPVEGGLDFIIEYGYFNGSDINAEATPCALYAKLSVSVPVLLLTADLW